FVYRNRARLRLPDRMKGLSLRAHILTGAIFWTIGLLMIAGIFLNYSHNATPPTLHHSSGHFIEERGFVLLRMFHSSFAHLPTMAVIAVLCMIVGFFQGRRGMSSINQLRSRLAAVHGGSEPCVQGAYPSEVQPLVDDLNRLLAEREKRMARAIAKAADLAH